jgi:hypothetical protein
LCGKFFFIQTQGCTYDQKGIWGKNMKKVKRKEEEKRKKEKWRKI